MIKHISIKLKSNIDTYRMLLEKAQEQSKLLNDTLMQIQKFEIKVEPENIDENIDK